MSKELEKIKTMIREQTEGMAEDAKIELLDALAWWAIEEAGSLNFDSTTLVELKVDSADAENYDE
ncbi:MAG: hypothetical protein HDS16_01240 [Bacteroides sp.]|nr:hypothetical protein [Bacteroides sp.]